MHRSARFSFTLALAAVALGPALLAAESYAVKIENNVAVKMRDGVTLRADVYGPKADGKFPVILEVASSNFPRFDRNLNTAESPESSSEAQEATNAIYHDRSHPSALLVPVVQ